jgi:hypothetical protein
MSKSEMNHVVFFWEMPPNNSKNQRRQIIDVYRQSSESLRKVTYRKHTRATSAFNGVPIPQGSGVV